jgi:hypothetical protein
MAALGALLGLPVVPGVAVVDMPGIDEGLAVLHEGEVEVHAADHLGHQTAVAVDVMGDQSHPAAAGRSGEEVAVTGRALRCLGQFGGIDAGEPHSEALIAGPDVQAVAVADRFHDRLAGSVAGIAPGPGRSWGGRRQQEHRYQQREERGENHGSRGTTPSRQEDVKRESP